MRVSRAKHIAEGKGVRREAESEGMVTDRIMQQAIAQQLTPIYEPLFSDGSYGYHPGRNAQQAVQKVKGYAEQA